MTQASVRTPARTAGRGERGERGERGTAGTLAALGLPGLVAVLVGLLATGASAATLVADPGAVTRWGQPLVRVVDDVAGALTVGLLVVAAVLLPPSAWGSRQRRGSTSGSPPLGGAALRATRLAGAAGGVWVLAGAVGVVLTWSRVSGFAFTDPQFGQGLGYYLTHLDSLRSLVISVLVAAVVATGATVATRHVTVGWLAVLALGALLPVALTGHAAGSSDHELAVDSLAFHLVGVTVWVGGLAALLLLRRDLGSHLAVTATRYSTLALAGFVLVGGSGVVNAAVRLGGFGGLASSYGALVVGKAVALVLLGLAGARHRSLLLGRLADGGADAARAFRRLATGEVVVMGVAIGLAVALSTSAPPAGEKAPPAADAAFALTGYLMPPPLHAIRFLTTWRADLLWCTVAAGLLAGYVAGVVRLRRRGDHWPAGRLAAWCAGCLVVVYATSGEPGVYGRVLFSQHMLGHMAMSMVAPPLLVLGAPVTLALRTLPRRTDGTVGAREWLLAVVHSRLLRVLSHPVVAAALFAVSLLVFYYSPLFGLALRTHTGHVLMHVHFLLTGYLFANVLVGVDPGPPRPAYPLRLLLLFATMAFHAFFGVALLQGSQVLAPDVLTQLGRTWGASPLADQQLGGGVAWAVGEVPTILLGMGLTLAWVRSDERESRRRDRQADRDDDAELAAYNAHLAQLADRDRRP